MRKTVFILLLLAIAGPALAETPAAEKPSYDGPGLQDFSAPQPVRVIAPGGQPFVYDAAPMARRLDITTPGSAAVPAPAPPKAEKAPAPPPPPHGFG